MKPGIFFWKMKPFDLLFMLDLESPWNDVVFRLTYPKPRPQMFSDLNHVSNICIDLYSILLY